MLEAVLKYLNNYFVREIIDGDFSIASGTLEVNAKNGQYIRIKGSALNDGVYLYPVSGLTDEDFTGEVWIMSIPKSLLEIVEKIDDFVQKSVKSPYQSESFGGYSYSIATDASGNAAGWQGAFAKELRAYKKI